MSFLSPATMKSIVIFTGITLILMTFGAYTYSRMVLKKDGKFFMPMIEQEWVMDAQGMKEAPSKLSLFLDSILFIPLYVTVFYILAQNINKAPEYDGQIVFYAIVGCAVIAALADYVENYFMWQLAVGKNTADIYLFKTYACFVKWMLIGTATVFVSAGYASMKNYWVAVPGFINAALLIYGTISSHALIQWGFGMLGVVLLIVFFFL